MIIGQGALIVLASRPDDDVVAVYGPFTSQDERRRWITAQVNGDVFEADVIFTETRLTMPPAPSNEPLIGLPERNGASPP